MEEEILPAPIGRGAKKIYREISTPAFRNLAKKMLHESFVVILPFVIEHTGRECCIQTDDIRRRFELAAVKNSLRVVGETYASFLDELGNNVDTNIISLPAARPQERQQIAEAATNVQH